MIARSTSAASHRTGQTGHTAHTGHTTHTGHTGSTGRTSPSPSPSPPKNVRAHSASPPTTTRPIYQARRHSASHHTHHHTHLHPAHALHPAKAHDDRASTSGRHRSFSHSHSHSHSHSQTRSRAPSDPSLHPSSSISRTPSTVTRAPRSPRLPRTVHAPDFTSSTTVQHGMTLEVPGADPAAQDSWGHEPPITPTIPDCQLIPTTCGRPSQQCRSHSTHCSHDSSHTAMLAMDNAPVSMPVPAQMPMPMPMPMALVPSSVAIAHMSRPHPHSIASPLTHTPLSTLGFAAVTPQPHGYGQPKYMKVVKPDYRRFCYSVGKADVPIVPMFQQRYPGGTIRGWDQEMSPHLVRRYGEWVV